MTSLAQDLAESRESGNGVDPERGVLHPAPGTYPPDAQLWLVLGHEAVEAGLALGLGAVVGIEHPVAYAQSVEWVEGFRDRTVAIVMDCDGPGRSAAERSAAALALIATVREPIDLDPERDDGYNLVGWLANARANGGVEAARDALVERLTHQPIIAASHESIAGAGTTDALCTTVDTDGSAIDGTKVDGAEVLDAVAGTLERFVVFPTTTERDAVALWIGHTYAVEAAHATPYLTVLSPEKGSGKSRLLEVIEVLAHRAYHVSNISEAALFRLIEEERPSLLLDEVDRLYSNAKSERAEMLTGIVNAGNRRGSHVLRCGGASRDELKKFDPFCPKVLAGIDTQRIPDTITDRAIEIRLQRKAPHERVERFRRRDAKEQAEPIRDRLAAWGDAHQAELARARPETPEEVSDRMAEAWEPLFAIAQAAEGDWLARCRDACLKLSGAPAGEDDVSLGSRLLMEIQDVFAARGTDWLWSESLCEDLRALDDAPWATYGKGEGGLTQRQLAYLLRPYGIRPQNIRHEGTVHKGYRVEDCTDAFGRYGRRTPPENRYVADGVAANVADDLALEVGCSGVADKSGEGGTGQLSAADEAAEWAAINR